MTVASRHLAAVRFPSSLSLSEQILRILALLTLQPLTLLGGKSELNRQASLLADLAMKERQATQSVV